MLLRKKAGFRWWQKYLDPLTTAHFSETTDKPVHHLPEDLLLAILDHVLHKLVLFLFRQSFAIVCQQLLVQVMIAVNISIVNCDQEKKEEGLANANTSMTDDLLSDKTLSSR